MEKEARDKGAHCTGGKQESPRGRGGGRRHRTTVGQNERRRALGIEQRKEREGRAILRTMRRA